MLKHNLPTTCTHAGQIGQCNNSLFHTFYFLNPILNSKHLSLYLALYELEAQRKISNLLSELPKWLFTMQGSIFF